MSQSAEYAQVEKPLVDQLASMGWQVIFGNKFEPSTTERESFREVILEDRFRRALRRINPGQDGAPWLDESRISEALGEVNRAGAGKLIDINERISSRLLEGVSVSGMSNWDQGRTQQIRFFDFQNPANNDFLAVSQFRVDEPGGQSKQFVVPDVVLFINGIPVVVIECKSPEVIDPTLAGIDQLRRYANIRNFGTPEGNERLFWTNQFVISTCGERSRVGTVTSSPEHYSEWKDPYPLSLDKLATQLGKDPEVLNGQEILVAGMLVPANILHIIKHFVVFTFAVGKRIKIVARYQQYRAVGKAVHRLRDGKTRLQDGEVDRRGGIIWHTQGSGKSLTMVFLVRAMRSDPKLRAFKVVFVTDRTDLEKQLAATAKVSGETIVRVRRARRLRKVLAEHGPGLVFAMIQKYRESDSGIPISLAGDDKTKAFGVLNSDESIVIMVDEAHRSQTSVLHANLMAALPNAARIGFTGTPIVREGKKTTASIFGPFIDKYKLRQAETDGAVLPTLYEGRTAKGAILGGSDLDQLFEDMFVEQTPDEVEQLKKRYATTGAVIEAPSLVAAKARSMIWHYLSTVFPGGFKAQVACNSRLATTRYRAALIDARDDFVKQVESLPTELTSGVDDASIDVYSLSSTIQILIRARPQLDLIRILEFVPVISNDNNDDPSWATWTNKSSQEKSIEDFKKPLGLPSEKTSPIAFLLVRTMLLTGFDAPIEQVLYLDRLIQDAELLQAAARVNRTAPGKSAGYIVDYYGVASHLQDALKAYASDDADDATGTLASIRDELPKLADRHSRVLGVFAEAGLNTFEAAEDVEACVQLLSDVALRVRFDVLLKSFLNTLDIVLPRSEGLPFVRDAKLLAVIQRSARRRYREDWDGEFDPSLYGEKVRALIDEHLLVLDIAKKIPPVSITDPDFSSAVGALTSDKAKAAEMEHAIRYHIRKNFDQDPARYKKLSDRLEEILKSLEGKWFALSAQLELLVEQTQKDTGEDLPHPDPLVARFFGLLEQEVSAGIHANNEVRLHILELATRIVSFLAERSRIVRFWQNYVLQEEVRRELRIMLDDSNMISFEEQEAVADLLMELARANRNRFALRLFEGPAGAPN